MTIPAGFSPDRRMLNRSNWYLLIIATVWIVAVAAYVFVWVVDPYQIRFGTRIGRLADHAYPVGIKPRLVPAAARDGVDLVIVGASTAMGYTPAMMRRAFADSRRPANLAFPCLTNEDLALILSRLESSPSLRRVIISLEYTLTTGHCPSSDSPMDKRYYAQTWYEPVPEFSLKAVELSGRVLRTGVLDMPEWSPQVPDRVDEINFSRLTAQPGAIAAISRKVETQRETLTRGPNVPCGAIPAYSSVIFPFVQRMAARGVSIDLLAPPYSLAFYSDWTVLEQRASLSAGSRFERAMAIRRCALNMSAGIPHVRLHSFDTDLSVVGDLSHYYDPAHIHDNETYDYVLRHIAAGDAVLAPGDWPMFEAKLKAEVMQYAPTEIRQKPAAPQ